MKIETRLVAKGTVYPTELTLDWAGVTPAQLQELAARSVVIGWQRVERDSGKIRPKDHVKVAEWLTGKGRPDKMVSPEKVLASVETMTPEAAASLLKLLTAKAKK